jgi:hypothetical protein
MKATAIGLGRANMFDDGGGGAAPVATVDSGAGMFAAGAAAERSSWPKLEGLATAAARMQQVTARRATRMGEHDGR